MLASSLVAAAPPGARAVRDKGVDMEFLRASRMPCVLAVLATGQVLAETSGARLEEIVVTARRVEERLSDVPLSVTVVGGARLDEFAVTRWEDLTLPGIKIGPAGILDVLSIRGIASGLNFGFEQSAPVYVDGVWFGSSRSTRSGFVDIERIEILKGPQPTHYGKNAIAGAFGIVTRKPEPDFAATVDTYYEFEHDETAVTGMLNLPLGETLAARLAGRWRDLDGFMTSTVNGRRTPQQRDELGRLALRWTPRTDLTLDGKLEYSQNTTRGRETQYVRCEPPAFAAPRLLNPDFEDCQMDEARGFRYDRDAFGAAIGIFDNPDRPGELLENEVLSGLVSGELDPPERARARPRRRLLRPGLLCGGQGGSLVDPAGDRRLRGLEPAVEPGDPAAFRAGRPLVLDCSAPITSRALATMRRLRKPRCRRALRRSRNSREDSDAWSLFAEAEVSLVRALSLRLAARFTEASRDFDADQTFYVLTPNAAAPGPDPWSFAVPVSITPVRFIETRQSRRDEELTPAATLEWRPARGASPLPELARRLQGGRLRHVPGRAARRIWVSTRNPSTTSKPDSS